MSEIMLSANLVTAVSVIDNSDNCDDFQDLGEMSEKRKRRRKRREKRSAFVANYDIAGVVRIILPWSSQITLGCVVGEHITAESSWIFIPKSKLEYELELTEESSALHPYKQDLNDYPGDDLLIGYIPAEGCDYDEFYLCLTIEARDAVQILINKIADNQRTRLENSINKKIGNWTMYGSADEVNETLYKPSRQLLEVEVAAKYPIISPKITFRLRTTNDILDGYAEFKYDKAMFATIQRRRIDMAIQVAPKIKENGSQTVCKYPKNMWTQYWYEIQPITELTKEFQKNFDEFLTNYLVKVCNSISVNSFLNLYTDDYERLVLNSDFTKKPMPIDAKEYLSFTDIKYCKGRMISSLSWHPMWYGTVAISYMSVAPNAYTTKSASHDPVNFTVHTEHVVLIWSFKDGLQAKLYLEAPREVYTVSFCPFNENIIIGGLANGQIAIWDITNKLGKVEEEEILTYAQQKYRVLMFSHMQWFQNIYDVAMVRCTAISNTAHSHQGSVTSIQWIDPNREVTRTGLMTIIPDGKPRSLQFITTADDGLMLFWDLNAKIVLQAGDYRPHRRSKRLKGRPSALTLDVSSYRILNRLFKPIYMVNLYMAKENLNLFVTCMNLIKPNIEYVHADPQDIVRKDLKMSDRIIFKAKSQPAVEPFVQEFYAGTLDGHVFRGRWDGYEVDAGEVVNKETVKVLNIGAFHDGPICSIARNKFVSDILLTVGGKVFAIWKENLRDRPIYWRRSRCRYTYGAWNIARRNLFRLCRSDGNRETWSILHRSDKCIYEQNLSGKILTGSFISRLKNKHGVNGIADYNGTLRLIYTPLVLTDFDKVTELNEMNAMADQCLHEVTRKLVFIEWQKTWNEKHAAIIEQKRDEAALRHKVEEEAKEIERQRKEDEEIATKKEAERLRLAKMRPPPGHYPEWARDQYLEREQERMVGVLLEKRRINPDQLKKQQMPLKQIEIEQQHKRLKQKELLTHSDQLFQDTVAMLFPNVVKKRESAQHDPYAGGDLLEDKQRCIANFNSIQKYSGQFVLDNPYKYIFNWQNVIKSNRNKGRLNLSHLRRLSAEKALLEEPIVPSRSNSEAGDADDEMENDDLNNDIISNVS